MKRWPQAPARFATVAPFRAWRGSQTLRHLRPKNIKNIQDTMLCIEDRPAEREGFEPSVLLSTHDFQSCTFGLSVTSPVSGIRALLTTNKNPNKTQQKPMAERGGFEPPVARTTLDFESSTLNRSDTSP